MTEDVRASPCAAMTDRTRLDRLPSEILALVSQFEGKGYSNTEVVRELLAAALSGLAARGESAVGRAAGSCGRSARSEEDGDPRRSSPTNDNADHHKRPPPNGLRAIRVPSRRYRPAVVVQASLSFAAPKSA